jgi:hypothetical protein
MKELASALPLPLVVYEGSDVHFEVYRAKDLHRRRWNNTALKHLVLAARSSYSRYGNRPLLDAYDAKAAIYLVRARYHLKGNAKEACEWLSVRMVPGDGKPVGVGEPEVFRGKGKTMDQWMRRKIPHRDLWKYVASSSRMCGTPVYTVTKDKKIILLKEASHRYTAMCFALVHRQFASDYPMEKFPYQYITAIIRADFYRKGLAHIANGRRFYPAFVPAHTFLGMKRHTIRTKRDIYSYAFPSYWLDTKKLLRLVNDLRKENGKRPVKELPANVLLPLARPNRAIVRIAEVRIAAKRIKAMLDKFVPDVPELKITQASVWYKSMDRIIKAGRLKRIEQPIR